MAVSKVKSNIEVINELYRTGALKSLVQSGLFPSKVVYHLEIYYYVSAKLEAGEKKTSAVRKAAVQFNIDERNVYRILKSFSRKFLFIYE